MTYTRGQPNRDDQGLESQPILLANNDAVDDIFDFDHYKYSDTVNDRGKHKAPRFKDQTSAGDPTTLDDEFALYAKEDSGSVLELFVRRPSNGSIIQLTNDGQINTGLVPVVACNFENDGTVQSGYNVASVTVEGTGRFKIDFTTPLADNLYEWNVQGMSSSGLLTASARTNATYSNSVNTDFFRCEFRDSSGSFASIVRGSVILFRRT